MITQEILDYLQRELESGTIEIKPFYVNGNNILVHIWTTGEDRIGFDWKMNA